LEIVVVLIGITMSVRKSATLVTETRTMNSSLNTALGAFIAIVVVHLLAPSIVVGGLFDDFNDNSADPTKWATDRTSGPAGIGFKEQSSRLELLSTSSDLNQSIVFRDALIPLRYDETWQVVLDAHMLLDVNTAPSARIGLVVFSPGLNNATGMLLKADDGARRLQGYDGSSFGPDFWKRPASQLADNGQISLSYDASNHLISLAFANGIGVEQSVTLGTLGIDGVSVGTLGTKNWGMTGSDLFTISLMGTTAGTPVATGEAWLDNVAVNTVSGDYNLNGIVDAADYTIWRDTLGSTTDLRANGDNTGSSAGSIDQADYNIWKANFGAHAGSGSGATAAVPEPASLWLLIVGAAGAIWSRRLAS
jgi:hypothetical protein